MQSTLARHMIAPPPACKPEPHLEALPEPAPRLPARPARQPRAGRWPAGIPASKNNRRRSAITPDTRNRFSHLLCARQGGHRSAETAPANLQEEPHLAWANVEPVAETDSNQRPMTQPTTAHFVGESSYRKPKTSLGKILILLVTEILGGAALQLCGQELHNPRETAHPDCKSPGCSDPASEAPSRRARVRPRTPTDQIPAAFLSDSINAPPCRW